MKLSLLSVAAISMALSGCVATDTETWFGVVADKKYDVSSCSHSYDCNCVCTSRDDDGGCEHESCQTCYDHDKDFYWGVSYDCNLDGRADGFSWDGKKDNESFMSRGSYLEFESCGDCSLNKGRQKIWDGIQLGDGAAVRHSFKNYLLVDPDTLHLNKTAYVPEQAIPGYPQVYSFHQLNSAMGMNTGMDTRAWNAFLKEQNVLLGNKLQVHMLAVATYDPNPLYADALAAKWVLGKKNNAIFVFGLNEDDSIKWSRLVSFSSVEMMRVHVRDGFANMHINDQDVMSKVVQITTDDFKRDHMADKAYLMRNTFWYRWGPAMGISLLLLAFSIVAFFVYNTTYSPKKRYKRRRR